MSPAAIARIAAIAAPLGAVPNTQWMTDPETGRSLPSSDTIAPHALLLKALSGTRLEGCERHWLTRFFATAIFELLAENEAPITLTEKGSAAQANPKVITLPEAFARASEQERETGKAAEPITGMPVCPNCGRNDQVEVSKWPERGTHFCACNEPGAAYFTAPSKLPAGVQNALDELAEIFARLDQSGLAHQSHRLSSMLFRAQRAHRLLSEELQHFATTLQ